MSFKVRASRCATCIYSKRTPIFRRTVEDLEDEVRDERGFFRGHRICHHTEDACCRGFWNRHKDDFPVGQIAQRLGAVEFTDEDLMPPKADP